MTLPSPPVFSVVLATFNPGAGFERAIESVLQQTRIELELLIVDDGSVLDFSHRIPHDERIRLIRHDENRGYGAATNTALDHARGQWLLFVDDDDVIAADYLQVMEAAGRKHQAQFVFSPHTTLTDHGVQGRLAWNPPAPVASGMQTVEAILAGDIIASQHLLFQRQAIRTPAPAGNTYSDIIFLIHNLLHASTVTFVEDAVYQYVIHQQSVTGSLRPTVWDLAHVPALITPSLEAAFSRRVAKHLQTQAKALVLSQMLYKAARETQATALRHAVMAWCQDRIRLPVLAACMRSGQYVLGTSLAVAMLSPSAHRIAYRARDRWKARRS